MTVDVKVPSAGESITEVFIARWHKKPGDSISKDEVLVEIETDKASMEIPAPCSGQVSETLLEEGDAAAVGDVIARILEGEVAETAPAAPTESAGSSTPAAAGHVMPAAARILAERGVDAATVKGTGPGGRVLKEDALAHNGANTSPAAATKALSPLAALGSREVEIVPMSPIRRRIAERLVSAQQNAALLTTFNEIDMTKVMKLRKEFKEEFIEKHGVKLGFMSFFVKATIEALKAVPALNAQVDGTNMKFFNYYDIGIAVGGGKGLVVPVVRNAETLGFAAVEKTIGDLARRARDNKISIQELQGGTFTISNGGVYGSLLSTPILNPPQSGILGLHAIKERPVGVDGEIVLRPMMNVALTYDHRIVDGREAVTFLIAVKQAVENPTRILLEV
ncbi:MAG: 2-oxoglutarate dehydrogenase complex dihydrolipoyllysine-residue succinyltransferase [Planctomycetota bacterium]